MLFQKELVFRLFIDDTVVSKEDILGTFSEQGSFIKQDIGGRDRIYQYPALQISKKRFGSIQ
jgi:hypothetical protein